MEPEKKLSCSNNQSDTTSSYHSICKPLNKSEQQKYFSPSCFSLCTTSSSTTSRISSDYFKGLCRSHKPRYDEHSNIKYELSIAKSVLKQYSALSGENLFDHLSDIIKRVLDERPPNVIDFFEEFSRNVREQKFYLPDRFPPDAVFERSYCFGAKKVLLSMKLNYPDTIPQNYFELVDENEENHIVELNLQLQDDFVTFNIFNERVQQFQFYWNQCGFSMTSDDIFQLACSIDRLQNHQSISRCRFWGTINSLKGSYFIVEAILSASEKNSRLFMAEEDLRQKTDQELLVLKGKRKSLYSELIGPELFSGNFGLDQWSPENLAKMRPEPDPVPTVDIPFIFDMPSEPFGSGVNCFSYFVVSNLADDWLELPIATPQQIFLSRQIKHFFTGDLEAEVQSYPCFPGKEKNLLRATIARITAGTHIAPRGYYRRMTVRENRFFEGLEVDLGEEASEEEDDEEQLMEIEEDLNDNDIVLVCNEQYDPQPLTSLSSFENWVHVRPNILNQGRVVYLNSNKARKEREKEFARLLKLSLTAKNDEVADEEEDEDEEDHEGAEDSEFTDIAEIGPLIQSPCHLDENAEGPAAWISRLTSSFSNKNERVLMMQSQIWPGAYTFTFDKICESIYIGWGHKYVCRNMQFAHLPPVVQQYPHASEDFWESVDPSVGEEEAYRLNMWDKHRRLEPPTSLSLTVEEGLFEDAETIPEQT